MYEMGSIESYLVWRIEPVPEEDAALPRRLE
jgi:hypothetical protein